MDALREPQWDTLAPDREMERFRSRMLACLAPRGTPAEDPDAAQRERGELLRELRAFLALAPASAIARISAVCAQPSGETALVAMRKLLMEFDGELRLLRRVELPYGVGCVCRLPDERVAVGCGQSVLVLDEQLDLVSECRGEPAVRKLNLTRCTGNAALLLCSDRTLRRMDEKHRVSRLRVVNPGRGLSRIHSAPDGSALRILYPADFSRWTGGAIYDYETDSEAPLGDRYPSQPHDGGAVHDDLARAPERVYWMDRALRIVPKDAPDDAFEVPYRGGFRIFGCSFRELRGGISENDKMTLYWNGGEIE